MCGGLSGSPAPASRTPRPRPAVRRAPGPAGAGLAPSGLNHFDFGVTDKPALKLVAWKARPKGCPGRGRPRRNRGASAGTGAPPCAWHRGSGPQADPGRPEALVPRPQTHAVASGLEGFAFLFCTSPRVDAPPLHRGERLSARTAGASRRRSWSCIVSHGEGAGPALRPPAFRGAPLRGRPCGNRGPGQGWAGGSGRVPLRTRFARSPGRRRKAASWAPADPEGRRTGDGGRRGPDRGRGDGGDRRRGDGGRPDPDSPAVARGRVPFPVRLLAGPGVPLRRVRWGRRGAPAPRHFRAPGAHVLARTSGAEAPGRRPSRSAEGASLQSIEAPANPGRAPPAA